MQGFCRSHTHDDACRQFGRVLNQSGWRHAMVSAGWCWGSAASMCIEDRERESMCWCLYSVLWECLGFIKSGCVFAMCLCVSVRTVLMLQLRVCVWKTEREHVLVCLFSHMSVSLFHHIRVRVCHVFVCLCRNSVDVTAASMFMEDREREHVLVCLFSHIWVSLFHQIRVHVCHVFACLCRNSVDVTHSICACVCVKDSVGMSMLFAACCWSCWLLCACVTLYELLCVLTHSVCACVGLCVW